MQIRVSLLPSLQPAGPDVDVAIVIDVLRATSVTAVAMQNGLTRILTCGDVEHARQLRDASCDSLGRPALLCGERLCQKIEGFDFGNSPAEYTPDNVRDREMVLTTTNGTRAVALSAAASELWLGSFVNRAAVLQKLIRRQTLAPHHPVMVHLVCAGTEGEITREDVLMAGAIAAALRRETAAELVGDQAAIAVDVFEHCFGEAVPEPSALRAQLAQTQGGRNLIQRGHADDLSRCAAIDSVDVVPVRETASTTPDGVTRFTLD